MYYVYLFFNKNKEIIYIGKTKRDIKVRMKEHFGPYGHLSPECYSQTKTIEYYSLLIAKDMDLAEAYLIKKYRPKYNTKKEYINYAEKQYIESKLINRQIYKGEKKCQNSSEQKQRTILNQILLKLKSILKNLILET